MTFFLFVISNKETLDFILKRVAKEYEISYTKTHGTLLTGITLENIKYKNSTFIKKIVLDWRITPLFYKKLSFKKIEIDNLNYSLLKSILEKKEREGKRKQSSFKIPFFDSIDIKKLYFSLHDFSKRNLKAKKIYLEADKIWSDFKDLKISDFKINLKSNIADILLKGFWEDKNIYVNLLKIENLDMKKLSKFLSQKSKKKSSSIFLINGIVLGEVQLTTKPLFYKNYNIKKITLNAENGFFDLKYLYLNEIKAKIDSNLGIFDINAKIDKNKLFAKSQIKLKNGYFKKYTKNIDFSKIEPIEANFELDKNLFRATVFLKAKDFLLKKPKKYGLQIKDSKTVISYKIKEKKLTANTNAYLLSQIGKISLQNSLKYNKNLKYKGKIEINELKNLPLDIKKIFKKTKILYEGDKEEIKGEIFSDLAKGDFHTKNFKYLFFNLFVKEFEKLNSKVTIHSKIDIKNPKLSKISFTLKNRYLKTDSIISFKNKPFIDTVINPQNEKLKQIDIFPIFVKSKIEKEKISSSIKGKNLTGSLFYNISNKEINSTLKIATSSFLIGGYLDKEIYVNGKIPSIRELKEIFPKEYKKFPVDGEISINTKAFLKKWKFFSKIKAKWLLYEYKKNHFVVAENFKSDLELNKNHLSIKKYSFNILDKHFFSNKESDIYFSNSKISINSLFINDKGVLKGDFYTKNKEGLLNLTAKKFHIKIKEAESIFDTKLSLKIKDNKKDIEGFIKLYKTKISYTPSKTYSVQDKDIIILQRKKTKEKKKDQISLNIRIFSNKPILYKTKEIKAFLKPDFTIWKEYNKKTEILGMVDILKGEVKKEDKEFKIESGKILFGGEALNPYLDIKMLYFHAPYEITITITGTLQSPIVLFSSDPYLPQSDILSLILFGTTSQNIFNKQTSSSSKIISIFGNTLAKELINTLGIKLDKLSLMTKENGSIGIEIGKRISKKITIIYRNDVVSTLIIHIRHSLKFETDITIKPNSSGIDFIYKKVY